MHLCKLGITVVFVQSLNKNEKKHISNPSHISKLWSNKFRSVRVRNGMEGFHDVCVEWKHNDWSASWWERITLHRFTKLLTGALLSGIDTGLSSLLIFYCHLKRLILNKSVTFFFLSILTFFPPSLKTESSDEQNHGSCILDNHFRICKTTLPRQFKCWWVLAVW